MSRNLYLINTIPKETFSKSFISICVPIYNIQKFLPSFIRSIQKQNFKNFGLILVDDNSCDLTEQMIKIFKKYYKRIKYIKSPINRGTGYSRALGIGNAKGKYINQFDADDLEATHKILKIIYDIFYWE